jgi:glycosyltransferase involved in cell wall biosynthesis
MRIGFLLPADFAIGNPGNGIAEQARRQAEALQARGHDVVQLDPWLWQDPAQFDVLQFYLGGPLLAQPESLRCRMTAGLLVFAPIIDSNRPHWMYALAARAGSLLPFVYTVPGKFRRQVAAAHLVVCRSSHERQRVIRGLGAAPDKVEVVLNGAPAVQFSDSVGQKVKATYGLPDEYLLHVGAFTQERKNVLRLVEAVEPLGYPLVIAGYAQPGAVLDELHRRAAGNPRLRILGFVDAETKAGLYASCRVFCLPSMHEGTGLAALEAGSYGANVVITSNGGVVDYFGSEADYAEPTSVASIRSAVRSAWSRPPTGQLRQRIRSELTWEKSAEALEASYLRHLRRGQNVGA